MQAAAKRRGAAAPGGAPEVEDKPILGEFERYTLARIVGPFGFFALALTGIIWLTQSLRVVDIVVNHGQSAVAFLEFSAMLLPLVMSIILPIAAFAASLFAINRLYSDSEVTAMFAAGMPKLRMVRPVALFGAGVMTAMFVITLYLMPTAAREMRDRIANVQADVAAAFVRDGSFVHPAGGLTVYVRETKRGGELVGVFVHDTRDPENVVTYTAERAAVTRVSDGPRLVMFDGVAQRMTPEADAMSLLRFDKLVYDLGALVSSGETRRRKPSEHYVADLLDPPEEVVKVGRKGKWIAEGHEQLSGPIYALVLPLIAVAGVLGGGFRRRGHGMRILVAIMAAASIRVMGLAAKSVVTTSPSLWPLFYVPPLIGIAAAIWILHFGPPKLWLPGWLRRVQASRE